MITIYDSIERTTEDLNCLSLVQRQLLALLRLAIGKPIDNCLVVCKIDWACVYAEAEKQSVVGLVFNGIERFQKAHAKRNQESRNSETASKMPPMDLLMDWLGQAEYIKSQNEVVNNAIEETVRYFDEHRMKGLVLKGQGLAKLYPQPELRTSGDIDFLITSADGSENTEYIIRKVKELVLEKEQGKPYLTYHHCDFGRIADVEVEVHYRPSWFYTPWYNARFQRFCAENLDTVESLEARGESTSSEDSISSKLSTISYPSLAFNRVYVLVHIFRHLYIEGIGIRQLIDYQMVLRESSKDTMWAQQKIETMQRLKELGMGNFTAAIMWILQEAFGMEERCLLSEPNEKNGRFLLEIIMDGGNFGKSYVKNERRKFRTYTGFAIRKIFRNIGLLRFCIWEVVFTPIWRLYHYVWMKNHGSRRLE